MQHNPKDFSPLRTTHIPTDSTIATVDRPTQRCRSIANQFLCVRAWATPFYGAIDTILNLGYGFFDVFDMLTPFFAVASAGRHSKGAETCTRPLQSPGAACSFGDRRARNLCATSMGTHMTKKEQPWTQTLRAWRHTSTPTLIKIASRLLQEGWSISED